MAKEQLFMVFIILCLDPHVKWDINTFRANDKGYEILGITERTDID